MTELVEILEAASAWGLVPSAVQKLEGQGPDEHWRLQVDGREFRVLRRYHPRHNPRGTAFEHQVLDFLAGLGWPVAAALPSQGGTTVVQTPAGLWALFPFLPGSPAPPDTIFLQRKGVVLAVLHRDLAGGEFPAQRPGFGRVTDLDLYLQPYGFQAFEDLAERLSAIDPGRAQALVRLRRRSLEECLRAGYEDLPVQVIHNQCLGGNVLFVDRDVTGLLDFGSTHCDARMADVGRSLDVDCGPDPALQARWLAGYAAFAEPPISPAEAGALPALVLASALWNTVMPLALALSGWGESSLLDSALRSLDHDLPRREAALDEMRRVALAAAHVRR
ncbi:MAG TPA: phosphotransferase [Candidatus Nitrosotenuis sp.]|jgi:Ser/Thr protein kinase RdoA (MazF antagonist)|nr:phosphotransferase [Candidatus Nitrosotenuis sp.]